MIAVALVVAATLTTDPPAVHNGRRHELDVRPPRVAADIVVDGRLDEPVWKQAAILTGFSRYAPTDGAPADDSTDVLVWYSATAIHFGIRAYAERGTVNATLADRDKIYNDDYVGIFLGTFNDGRQAMVFAVNPLGVQGDGMVVERGAGSSGFGGLQTGREATDIAPDFVFESKGRVTEYGYEVEIRIPFKSLRYQSGATQTWGLNVMRRVQSRGVEYSWAPAQRAAASYVGQFGRLNGLTDLDHGTVLDLNPVVTARSTGAPDAAGRYDYQSHYDLGGNVRWGFANNWTLNGTINPDFAEVESDAGQAINDPRISLFFPEKRPFFLDGSDQFTVPNSLVYTRRIADPVAAVKLTGKSGGTSVALLSAVDSKAASLGSTSRPLYDILRVQHDFGAAWRLGLVYTDRREAGASNEVVGVDGRVVAGKIYSGLFQAAMSDTRSGAAPAATGSVFLADLRRSGHAFNVRWYADVMDDKFATQTGFISRPSLAHAFVDHSYTLFGAEQAAVRNVSFDVYADGIWQYQRFVHSGDMIEKKLHFNNNVELRGGWQAGASLLLETFGYDPGLYSDLYVARPRSAAAGAPIDTVPYTGTPRLPNRDYVLSLTTPSFKTFSSSGFYLWGRDENFFEWAPSDIIWASWTMNWRPTDQFRASVDYNWQRYARPSDGSVVGETRIPRVKVEYQLSRSVFVRIVGEYSADYADDLRDDSRTFGDVFRFDGATLVRGRGFSTVDARGKSVNEFRPQLLFSYLPTPGTVLYAGYGGTLTEPESFRLSPRALTRASDAFFVKMSYLFRD